MFIKSEKFRDFGQGSLVLLVANFVLQARDLFLRILFKFDLYPEPDQVSFLLNCRIVYYCALLFRHEAQGPEAFPQLDLSH